MINDFIECKDNYGSQVYIRKDSVVSFVGYTHTINKEYKWVFVTLSNNREMELSIDIEKFKEILNEN